MVEDVKLRPKTDSMGVRGEAAAKPVAAVDVASLKWHYTGGFLASCAVLPSVIIPIYCQELTT